MFAHVSGGVLGCVWIACGCEIAAELGCGMEKEMVIEGTNVDWAARVERLSNAGTSFKKGDLN